MGQNSSRWQRTSRRTTRSSVSCLGGSTSTTISTKWLQSKPVSGTYPINKLLWLRGTFKKKNRPCFTQPAKEWLWKAIQSLILHHCECTKHIIRRIGTILPLKILGLLFVKQTHFYTKDTLYSLAMAISRRRSFKISCWSLSNVKYIVDVLLQSVWEIWPTRPK